MKYTNISCYLEIFVQHFVLFSTSHILQCTNASFHKYEYQLQEHYDLKLSRKNQVFTGVINEHMDGSFNMVDKKAIKNFVERVCFISLTSHNQFRNALRFTST